MNDFLATFKPCLLNVGYAKLDNSWDYDNVVSPFSRVYLALSGTAKVHHHQQVFTLTKNHIYLIPSFTYSRYKCNNHSEQYYIHFTEDLGNGLSIYNRCSFLYEKKASVLEVSLFERLIEINPDRSLFSNNTKIYDNQKQAKIFAARNNFSSAKHYLETQGLLKILFSSFITGYQRDDDNTPTTYKTIYNIQEYISAHLSENLTVAHLAKQCHLNPDYFSRLFKESTGVRPVVYMQNKKIERAQLLLTTTTYQLQEIADMVGLSNISYFNRLFTRICQVTPLKYRQNHWSV